MLILAIAGGLLLAVALFLRELQLHRERRVQMQAAESLRVAIEVSNRLLRRAREDLFVLHSVLKERNLINEEDLVRIRARLIDTPRRLAEEREELLQDLEVAPTQLILDDGDKIH